MNGCAHALVGAASAQIGHGFIDVGIGGFWFSFEEGCRCHEHAALAVAALGNLLCNPCQLLGVWFFGGAQGFDGLDVGTGHAGRWCDA